MSESRSELQQMIDRFSEQTPIVRGGVAIAAAIILYLAWSGFLAPTARSWGESAAAIERDVRTIKSRDRLAADVRRLRDSIITLGPVDPPVYITDGEAHLMAAINVVKQDFRMSNDSFSMLARGPLQRGMLHGLTVSGEPTQLTGEFRFDAEPEEAISIIAALEARPEIARINQVLIQRSDARQRSVNVRLTIESWVVSSGSSRRGRV